MAKSSIEAKAGNCYLFHKSENGEIKCRALESLDGCGKKCKFRKTIEEQEAIEKKCHDRLIKVNPFFDYRSCIDGKNYEKRQMKKDAAMRGVK